MTPSLEQIFPWAEKGYGRGMAIPLEQWVPVTHYHGACAHSPYAVGQPLPLKGFAHEQRVKAIAHLTDQGRPVGWIYRSDHNHFFIQVTSRMSEWDRALVDVDQSKRANGRHWMSRPVEIKTEPWQDVRITPCR